MTFRRVYRLGPLRWSFVFAWYDFWIGAYYDRKLRRLYVLPLPMLGVWLEWRLWR